MRRAYPTGPLGAVVLAYVGLLALGGCSKNGGGQVTTSLRAGETVTAVLEVKAGESEGGDLESCDLVVLNEQDFGTVEALAQMDVTLGKPGKSDNHKCGVVATITGHDDAVAGDYVVEATFFYKYSAVFQGTQEGDDIGAILITIAP
ncbi:MAG: hypothetical protein IPK07_18675 [Deltaproteobacteria bacterium]|jgi:hypothetical protein|nr:hypothetical protein [Deltaproteobacteria bacterium]